MKKHKGSDAKTITEEFPARVAADKAYKNAKKNSDRQPQSFSVVASREHAKVEETPGYFVKPDLERQIMDCLAGLLLVESRGEGLAVFESRRRQGGQANIRARIRDQLGFLRSDHDQPFGDLLDRPVVERALIDRGIRWSDWVLTPLVTLWTFVAQVLDSDHSCRAAVATLGDYLKAPSATLMSA